MTLIHFRHASYAPRLSTSTGGGGPATGVTLRFDGVEFGPAPFAFTGTVRQLYIGARVSAENPNHLSFDDILVGTSSYGSSDVFSANFSSGPVPPFDSSSGSGISLSGGQLEINNTGTDAYVTVDLGSDFTELWLQFKVTFATDMVPGDSNIPPDIVEMYDTAGGTLQFGFYPLDYAAGTWQFYNAGDSVNTTPGGAITGGTQYTIDIHIA